MSEYKYVYGPVPSRRMGLSLGVSPIPPKYCNYSCIYCQLGRTVHLTNKRENYMDLEAILEEFKDYSSRIDDFDVVTIVGEGEPTLYARIGELIHGLKGLTHKPIAVITNGSLLYEASLREELKEADIVLPSLDAFDEESFKRINRPFGTIRFKDVIKGLQHFSEQYQGQLWLEVMLMKDINDSMESILKMKMILETLQYDRLYINTPVRPPAENFVQQASDEAIMNAVEILGGISIDKLESEGFYSNLEDHYEALKSIIGRHPMNQFEIQTFLEKRECDDIKGIFKRLSDDPSFEVIEYKSYETYRLKL